MKPRHPHKKNHQGSLTRDDGAEDAALRRRVGRHLWQPMTPWFSPRLLLRTLFMVLAARLFGRYADRREVQAARPADGPYRYDDANGFWFDYVADLGDGWNATATIASALAAPELIVEDTVLPHGRVLVMGGDEVYPAASREEYLRRLEAPYYSVLPFSADDAPRDLFLLPGNHDWYDGLAAFSRLFMQQRWFAGWRTRQSRSYFVLQLPQHWWLIAADIQLDNDIDTAQLDYLLAATANILPGDSILLATAEPFWLAPENSILRRNLAYLERKLVTERGASVRLYLSGDLHHYQRHENVQGAQRIVSGGGGAFLHGTAWQPEVLVDNRASEPERTRWRLRKLFPSPLTSRLATWRVLLFPFFNPGFAILLGSLLTMLLWGLDSASHGLLFGNIANGAELGPIVLAQALPWSPWLLLAMMGWFSAFVAFVESPPYWPPHWQQAVRVPLGMLHGLLQLLLGIWALHVVDVVAGTLSGVPSGLSRLTDPLDFFAFLLVLGSLLSLLCGLLFGAYLFLTWQLSGFHRESVFAAARIADWKHFLRLHIAEDGTLNVYVLGVARVCRRWRERTPVAAGEAFVETADGISASRRVQLVEKVVIRR